MSGPPRPTVPGYRLVRWLGQGGMGSVWEARALRWRRATRPGQRVVIKILHPHLSADRRRVRDFKREAGIGMTIDHPNLVRVHGLGTARTASGPLPYLVMDYLDGHSLQSLVGASVEEPGVRDIGAQIAAALSALHARRLIHRDLKPENIFIDSRGHVTVVDYGLSVLLHDESDAKAEDAFAGTLAYAAPERLRVGARVGPASDLFSLGVLLFELATGRHPFRSGGDDLSTLIGAIEDHQPPPPSRYRASLSYLLDRLVSGLLEKDPAERTQPAAAVEEILRDGERSAWWSRRVRATIADVAAGKRVLAVDRRTRMCGRDAELEHLLQAARDVFQGRRRRVALVVGQAGLGKSRLVDELAERMDQEGHTGFFLVGRTFSTNVPLPYEAVTELIERAFGVRGLDDDSRCERLAASLAELLDVPGPEAEEAARFLTGQARTEWSRPRAVALFRSVLASFAARTPGVLVFEGVDRAGEGTLDVFEDLALGHPAVPLLIVATARPGETGGATARRVASLEGALAAREEATVLRLAPLRRDDVRLMLGDLGVPATLRDSLADRLMNVTGAHPEAMLLLARLLEAEGQLERAEREGPDVLDLPGSPLEIRTRRLVSLRDEERRYLEAGAVQGLRFDPRATASILGLDLSAGNRILTALEHEHRLVRRTENGARFMHSWIRTLLYESVDPEVQRSYHREMARYLVARGGSHGLGGRRALRAAVHALAAGDARLVGETVLEAAGHLVLRQLPERAVKLIDSALELADEVFDAGPQGRGARNAVDRPALHLLHADLFARLGMRQRQAASLTRALRRAVELDDGPSQATAQLGLARLHLAKGRYLAGLSAVQAVEERFRRQQNRAGAAEALAVEADLLAHLGDEGAASAVVSRALIEDARAGKRRERGRVLADLGRVLAEVSAGEETFSILRRALAEAREAADVGLEAEVDFHLGLVHRDEAFWAEAMHEARLALAGARRIRNRFLEGRTLYLIGSILLRAGRPDRALLAFERALPMAARVEDPYLEVYLRTDTATALLDPRCARRDVARAVAQARLAVAKAAALDLGRERLLGHAVLAMAYLAQGKTRWAAAIVAKASRTAELVSLAWRRASQIHMARYEVMRAMGRRTEAAAALREAHEIVQATLRRRRDPEARQRLARRDPVFRAVLKAWNASPARRLS